jgi:probable rRNA maturation factor
MTPSSEGPTVDITLASPLWDNVDCENTIRRALAAAAPPSSAHAELSVVLTDDAEIRRLNARWRSRDEPTNVLSFPVPRNGKDLPRALGDIVIAYETTAREANEERKTIEQHLAHLAVHGFLHLLGYDHESAAEADEMEQLERNILAKLDIPDPYASRDEE